MKTGEEILSFSKCNELIIDIYKHILRGGFPTIVIGWSVFGKELLKRVASQTSNLRHFPGVKLVIDVGLLLFLQ